MGRKALDPEIRRQMFISAAEELFREKGYDTISVTEIAKKAGVSHGAFFYYFKSKEEIMRAIIFKSLTESESNLKALVGNKDISALEKIRLIFSSSIDAFKNERKYFDFVRSPTNTGLRREYILRSREITMPLVYEILEQGIREGSFTIAYPKETLEYIIYIFENLEDSLFPLQGNDEYYRKIRALEILLSKALGIKENQLSLI